MASPLSAAGASPEPSPSSPLSPLLRLPPHTQQRIYRYLGLESWDGRPDTFYLYAGHLKRGHSPCISRHPPPDPKSYHGLLLSCRAIHAKTTGLLYSSNHFVLYYCKPPEHPGYPISSRPLRTLHPTSFRPLHTLHALTESSLHSLSNLKIVLNEAAGHQLPLSLYSEGSCCADGRGNPEPNYLLNPDFFLASEPRHKGLHRLPLLSSASMEDHSDKWAATNSILGEWNVAATRLLSHIAPGRLSLSVVCDIDPKHPQALDIAKSVVAPIRLLPPSNLKECRVRLAKTPDGRLRQLAEDTVSYACGIPTMSREPPSNMAATLTTLPRELRIKILEYTDLVTPRRQVIWTRQQRAYTVLTPACGPGPPSGRSP
ncbi:predicted protein [Chaetomium globosum CBS 148.51]|uniref:F-box domain-containing protein n=1 Tax=Chaetomium globosum (strain ATCC 6205 / CBS 148.51 / DSM 1962 / NBRC 6347 / NRRL 1970) TaxID=306901 RepID=Q2GPZ1_CHAGB|nr:uncharacterized protein CHGG_09963 [Chaetomium globosum CBS 148.51]EAQ83559.1 predicted protein [Chaetomium globosum CBS 148.51]